MLYKQLGVVIIFLIIYGISSYEQPGAENIDFKSYFQTIYSKKIWNPVSGQLSGIGSNPCRYFKYLVALQRIIDFQDVEDIVQIGFGDFEMNQHIIFQGKRYQGYDVVPILKRQSQYNLKFDIIKDLKQIKDSGDLLIIKDVMQHWPNVAIYYLLKEILPRFKYALITNDMSNTLSRADIPPGGHNKVPRSMLPPQIQEVLSIMEPYYNVEKKSFLYKNPRYKKR